LVGFSGGGDSTALLALIAPIARRHAKPLIALIVDHALRSESASEAAAAAAFAEDLGASAQIVRLDWAGSAQPGQASARHLRHRAFADAARRVGTDRIHLGHTIDDQCETILMRVRHKTGRRGLAGMAALEPSALWPDGRALLISRPLLAFRRAELRAFLRASGLAWVEDPSNAALRYERVRIRALLDGADTSRLLSVARAVAAWRARIDEAAVANLAARRVEQDQAQVDGALLDRRDAAAIRILAVLSASFGGAMREPSAAAVLRLRERLLRDNAATLSGALWRRRWGDLRVERDPGGVQGRADGAPPLPDLALPRDEEVVWDARLAVTARRDGLTLRRGPTNRSLEVFDGDEARGLETVHPDGMIDRVWLPEIRIRRLLWRAYGDETLTGCV
jgi:tRNA(Ile)-lysidine synthase